MKRNWRKVWNNLHLHEEKMILINLDFNNQNQHKNNQKQDKKKMIIHLKLISLNQSQRAITINSNYQFLSMIQNKTNQVPLLTNLFHQSQISWWNQVEVHNEILIKAQAVMKRASLVLLIECFKNNNYLINQFSKFKSKI